MKNVSKRWLALLLALLLAFTLVTPAFAADSDAADIEVTDSVEVPYGLRPIIPPIVPPIIPPIIPPVRPPVRPPVDDDDPTDGPVTIKDLPDYAVAPEGATETTPLTVQDVIFSLLKGSGLTDEQLGEYPYDYNAFALSLGMIDGDTDLDAACTAEQLAAMKVPADELHDAVNPEDGKLLPAFINGRAQPIFPYTDGTAADYSNAESDIIRYCVYVETNHDTDGDGKLDLVKTLVQLPRSAAEGNYKAATIFEARPYITGTTKLSSRQYTAGERSEFDYDDLYATPDPRIPAGAAVSTLEAAKDAVSSEWYYWNSDDSSYEYEDLTWYDYYLVRGFAVVESGGIGTKGSEGYETCGTDLEIDAFKCIVEWLNGDRVAYTDKTSNIPVAADWSAHSVGTTGRSYAGTTQFGLATTGVDGLKTIVPVAGIASWYEYTNSQGISTRSNPAYEDYLAAYCAGRYLDKEDFPTIQERYYDYLNQLYVDQRANPGDYFEEVWGVRDYTLNAENIKIPALIVHGLNDYNVRTKETDLMYRAFKEAGLDDQVKLIFHQDGHLTPTYPAGGLEFLVNGQLYDEILNQWFSHYLCGIDNGVEDMPAVQVQSNQNPDEWDEYDSWESDTLAVAAAADSDITITSNYASFGVTSSNWQATFSKDSTPGSAMFVADVEEDTVIKGSIAVSFTATVDNEQAAAETPNGDVPSGDAAPVSTPNGDALDPDNFVNPLTFGIEDVFEEQPVLSVARPEDGDGVSTRNSLMVSAMLVDLSDTAFDTVNTSGSYVTKEVLREDGAWQGGGLANWDFVRLTPTSVNYKIVARGWMDLCNPGAGYDSKSAGTKAALDPNTPNDYTIYLQPNVYKIPAGHKLAVVIYAYEPGFTSYSQQYLITLKKGSVSAQLPVDCGKVSEASYQEELYNLAVSTTPRNSGTVTIKNEADEIVSAGAFAHGAKLKLTANPADGYALAQWTVNNVVVGTEPTLELTMDCDKTVSAVFESTTCTLTIEQPENGTITSSAEGGKINKGDTVTFTAQPASGYSFAGWVIDGKPGGTENPLTLTIGENTKISATFERTSSGGGGGGSSAPAKSPITIDETDNATVTADASSAKAGQTVTITVKPDEGYKVEKVKVTDKNGSTVKVTDNGDGTYSFKMPATGVTVTPVIGKTDGRFVDVPVNEYFFDPVYWAVGKGITAGTDDTHFSPDGICTRAQMLTFLWRALGKPAASDTVNPFKDVEKGAYYYDAVLWGIEKGVTNGVSATAFDPDSTVTRAQAAAFLYRYYGKKTETANPFTDVEKSAYYFDAVLWAAANKVTTGKTATTFDPNGGCTRAQVMTFLYRAAQ